MTILSPNFPPRSRLSPAAGALFGMCLLCGVSRADTVWNVNVGSASNQITTGDNYTGAATENTANSTWNHVSSTATATLADSTGNNSAGITFTIVPAATSTLNFGVQALTTGDKIFRTWIKDNGNDDLFTITFGNLNPASTYSLVVYSDWFWANGNGALPVTQTSGTGLIGTYFINRDIASGINGVVGPLLADTNPANVASGETNHARFNGLIPGPGNTLSFSMGGVNGPVNGFQLVETSGGAPDTAAPVPNPMSWSSLPAAAGPSGITMTATTATDASGVEYFFDETSGNPGGTDSGWQDSPIYIDTGLDPNTAYTYTVTARDKSANQNTTTASAPASATTGSTSSGTVVWNVNIGGQTIPAGYGGAIAQTSPVQWNSITTSSVSGLALKDANNSTAAGITLDVSSDRAPGGQALTSGDAIFAGYFGGAGASTTITLNGLTPDNAYDILFYSDWFWRNGDSLPVTQTLGGGLTGTYYINRNLSGTNGVVPALAEDTNPANVTSGAGNNGNYCRIVGITPDLDGKVRFRVGDGNNTAFSAFQLVRTGVVPPRADILAFGLPGNAGVINNTDITIKVPFGTDRSDLAPDFTLWPGATCVPVSGTSRNFNSPRTYTVTSSDSLVTKTYTAAVEFHPPLPEFTLSAPANWDGRQTITVQPVISNLPLLQANNGTSFTYEWSVENVAVTRTISPAVMSLTRAQGNGPLVVTLTLSNGSVGVTRSTVIDVQQPATDPWIERSPLAGEKPVAGQFFARNPSTNLGTIFYRGTESGSPDDVYLKVYRTPSGGAESLHATHRQALAAGAYDFTATLEAGLFTYRVVYGTRTGGVDTDITTVNNLVCGDAFIIAGQSNAQATDNAEPQADDADPWVKTYNASLGWVPAYAKPTSPNWGSKIGFWGMKLARDLVTEHQIPVCIINGAVGGTRIDQHQPNPGDRTVGAGTYDIYANLLNRVLAARLSHGIRGVFWHQGESDGGSAGPPLEPDHQFYENHFLAMSSAWKEDFPNLRNYIIYQVEPNPCGLGPFASEVRDIQRRLPRLYSNMSVLHNLNLPGYEGCHYSRGGYESMADRLLPVVRRDFYGFDPGGPVTPPNLIRARFTSGDRTAIALEFDQAMSWNMFSTPNLFINGAANMVASGGESGNIVTLQLTAPASANATLQYLRDSWNRNNATLLYGANGLPALSFTGVPIEPSAPYQSWVESRNLSGPDAAGNADPDNDGLENALEYVLGGEPNPANPGSNSAGLVPIPAVGPTGDLVFTFPRRIESTGNVSLVFEWSDDLEFSNAASLPIGATGSSFEGINVAINPIDSATEEIVVTVPALRATNGKLFGRLRATIL